MERSESIYTYLNERYYFLFYGLSDRVTAMNSVFWGKVRQGKKRGKDLGFPTANMLLHKKIPEGIYISRTTFDKNTYNSLTFIGSAKTFGETDVKAETYILDHTVDMYGKWITVRLLKKTRENIKFTSSKDLIKQMKKDKQIAQEYFKQHKHV